MGCIRGVLCVRLWGSRLPLGSVFRFGFCGGVLFVSGVAHCGCGVSLVGALGGLLFLFFLFRRFLCCRELLAGFFPVFSFFCPVWHLPCGYPAFNWLGIWAPSEAPCFD